MESRIVIHTPTGKDARLIAQVLARAGVESYVCERAADVAPELLKGAAALLVADDALKNALLQPLFQVLADQPTWSDLPIIVLNQRGIDTPESRHTYAQLGNVTLVERPVQGVTLASAATSALRARQRQYGMREVDRRKDEFLAMLAHELRNPLAPVSAASDLLKLPNLTPEKVRRTSDIISRQVKHMTGLIDDLLDVSRVSRGLVTLELSTVDARVILTSAVEQVRPLIDTRRQLLTVHTAAEPVYLDGDHKRLVQIISNVLNNASKYTPETGGIVLSLDVTDASVNFTVRDDGIGMASDVIGHIFDMFAQAERTPDRTQGGLGIGLALVKSLVQLHNGQVSAESAGANQGSCFRITFPRSFPAQPLLNSPLDHVDAAAAHIRVLLVDDNVDAATMLGMFLETAGYRVEVVHSAEAALETAIAAKDIDACLLDIGLPGMDGNDLARRLRTLPATEAAMLIAITGYGQESDRARSRDAGFDHHHVKPVEMESLLATLATLH